MAKRSMNLVALIFLGWLLGTGSAQATPPNRAGLVVVHGNGQSVRRCIEFTEAQLSGLDLLTRSGLDLNVDATNAIGVAVCRIDKEGCTFPNQPCFCQCQGLPCIYWSYWRLTGGAWKYSSVGASSSIIRNGDVDGWVWGIGTISGAMPPPTVTFDQICAPATPTSTRTATPTLTVTPLPTNTFPRATATRAPTTRALAPPTLTHTPSPQPTDTPRLVSRTLPTWTKTLVPAPTATEAKMIITPSPTSAPIVHIQTPFKEQNEEPLTETSASSTSHTDTVWGSALRLAGVALSGCVLGSVMLIVAGLTLVVLKRLV